MVLFRKAAIAFWGEVVIAFFEFNFFLWEQHITKVQISIIDAWQTYCF